MLLLAAQSELIFPVLRLVQRLPSRFPLGHARLRSSEVNCDLLTLIDATPSA
jgi:hypothetical protein